MKQWRFLDERILDMKIIEYLLLKNWHCYLFINISVVQYVVTTGVAKVFCARSLSTKLVLCWRLGAYVPHRDLWINRV